MLQNSPMSRQGSTPPGSELTFIVGTGRCGSTMLSGLLRDHPAILSISEFFALLPVGTRFPKGVIDAAHFWSILSTPHPYISTMLKQGYSVPEFLYPNNATSTYTSETGIPPILLVTLPHLTPDYEALYVELQHVVRTFPPDRIARHYLRLFGWLGQRFGRRVYIERSGVSLTMLHSLIRHFPTAKFVHLVRDGRDCAMSISNHETFRFTTMFYTTTQQDRVNDLKEQKSPFEIYGQFWSDLLLSGFRQLAALPEEQVLTLTYEQVVAQPQQSLTRLLRFMEPSLVDHTWIESVAGRVRQKPPAWTALSGAEIKALEAACRPGQSALEVVLKEGLHSEHLPKLLQHYS